MKAKIETQIESLFVGLSIDLMKVLRECIPNQPTTSEIFESILNLGIGIAQDEISKKMQIIVELRNVLLPNKDNNNQASFPAEEFLALCNSRIQESNKKPSNSPEKKELTKHSGLSSESNKTDGINTTIQESSEQPSYPPEWKEFINNSGLNTELDKFDKMNTFIREQVSQKKPMIWFYRSVYNGLLKESQKKVFATQYPVLAKWLLYEYSYFGFDKEQLDKIDRYFLITEKENFPFVCAFRGIFNELLTDEQKVSFSEIYPAITKWLITEKDLGLQEPKIKKLIETKLSQLLAEKIDEGEFISDIFFSHELMTAERATKKSSQNRNIKMIIHRDYDEYKLINKDTNDVFLKTEYLRAIQRENTEKPLKKTVNSESKTSETSAEDSESRKNSKPEKKRQKRQVKQTKKKKHKEDESSSDFNDQEPKLKKQKKSKKKESKNSPIIVEAVASSTPITNPPSSKITTPTPEKETQISPTYSAILDKLKSSTQRLEQTAGRSKPKKETVEKTTVGNETNEKESAARSLYNLSSAPSTQSNKLDLDYEGALDSLMNDADTKKDDSNDQEKELLAKIQELEAKLTGLRGGKLTK